MPDLRPRRTRALVERECRAQGPRNTLLAALWASASLGLSNDRGQVVGLSDSAAGCCHAFLWTVDSGMVDLGTLPGGSFSTASAINDRGQVVGVSYAAGLCCYAFLWDAVNGMYRPRPPTWRN